MLYRKLLWFTSKLLLNIVNDMVIYMSEFPPWNLLTNFDLWFIVDMKIAQIYKLTWVLYYNLNIFEFIYCLCYIGHDQHRVGGAGRRRVSGLCQDRVWPTGGQTLHQPRQTNVGQRSILLNLRNYLIILLPSRNFKKLENLSVFLFSCFPSSYSKLFI